MDAAAVLVLAVTAATLYLLFSEKASLDAVGLGILVALVGGGELIRIFDPAFDPETMLLGARQALENVGNGAVMTVAGLYVLGEGLSRTGAVEFIVRVVTDATGGKERRIVLVLGLVAGVVSAFLANTAVVLIFVPVILDLARRTHVHASRLLLPLAYATLFGGMCTLVGTSTNLLVSGVAEADGFEPIGMFEMAPIGVPMLLVATLGMAIFARRLFPVRHSLTSMLGGDVEREYVTELVIGPTSALIGRKYADAFEGTRAQLLFFVRNEEMHWPPFFNETIAPGDVVMLRGGVDVIAGLQEALGLKLFNDSKFDAKSMTFFELAVAPHSSLLGREIGDLHLLRDFGVVTMAVLRGGHHIRERASKLRLDVGDLLLVLGDPNSQARIRASGEFYLLTGAHNWVVLRNKARTALLITVAVMLGFTCASMAHAARLLPWISIAGAFAIVASGCLTGRRAYRTLDWPVLIFIVGTIGLGQAMTNTGLAGQAAGALVRALDSWGPVAVLGGLSLLCGALTNIISNNAVGVLVTPIAIRAAQRLGELHPELDRAALVRAFILTVAFSASLSFATHWGHQVNLMVYGPGGYKPADFLRAGLPITFLAWIAITLGVSFQFGLL
jgi:di/tricarboxylate transporter